MKTSAFWMGVAITSFGCPVAFAVDGVIEINQVCAEVGCFDGDAPGFPVTISAPGSYRLTGNLTVIGTDVNAIELTTNEVTLDLNGFTIYGTGPAGTGDGITSDSSSTGNNVVVTNGTVRDMASFGIDLNDDCRIENVRAIGNDGPGIRVERGGQILNSLAANNDDSGIVMNFEGLVRSSVVRGNRLSGIDMTEYGSVIHSISTNNGTHGIDIGYECVVVDNNVSENGEDGITTGDECTVRGNTVLNNGSSGIVSAESTIIGNTVARNDSIGISTYRSTVKDNTVSKNGSHGIDATGNNLVLGNLAYNNAGFGLYLGSSDGYGHNVVNANNGGNANPQVNGGIRIETNVCGGDTICP